MDIFSQLKEAIAEAERQAKEQMEKAVAAQQAQAAKQAQKPRQQQGRGGGQQRRQPQQRQQALQPTVEAAEVFSVPECDPEPHLHAPEEAVRVERSVGAVVLGGLNRDQLRRAVLLREILGPPPGLLDD
ncbi:MAG: hypothetical protein AB7S38_01040 [Vulcanimicrobiota bacterium]